MSAQAQVHVQTQTMPHSLHLHWHTEPGLLAGLLLIIVLYGVGVGWLRYRLAPGVPWPRWQALRFLLGLGLFYGAVASPLDSLGEQFLLSAHMVQHLLLIYPVPLLLLTGLPGWFLRPCLTHPWVAPLVRGMTTPLVALVLFHGTLAVWHIPGLYEWALRDRTVHNVEHLTFLSTAVVLWWPLVSPVAQFPRLSCGVQVLYLLAMVIGQIPVFAYVTFASTVLYPTYEMAPRLVPLTALEDQQLGGILMHTVSTGVLFVTLVVVFRRWYQAEHGPYLEAQRILYTLPYNAGCHPQHQESAETPGNGAEPV